MTDLSADIISYQEIQRVLIEDEIEPMIRLSLGVFMGLRADLYDEVKADATVKRLRKMFLEPKHDDWRAQQLWIIEKIVELKQHLTIDADAIDFGSF